MKLSIKTIFGEIMFEHECENNTIKKTVEALIKKFDGDTVKNADLSNMQLDGISFDNSSFDNSRFYNSSFYNSSFDNSSFYNSSFDNSSFDNSSFYNSSFYNSRFDAKTVEHIRASGQLSMFNSYRNDLWAKLLILKNEIPAFKQSMIDGKINGSAYEGECACFCGTMANIQKINYQTLAVKPDQNSPVEKWFYQFKPGDTPENHAGMKLTMEWIEEFESLLK